MPSFCSNRTSEPPFKFGSRASYGNGATVKDVVGRRFLKGVRMAFFMAPDLPSPPDQNADRKLWLDSEPTSRLGRRSKHRMRNPGTTISRLGNHRSSIRKLLIQRGSYDPRRGNYFDRNSESTRPRLGHYPSVFCRGPGMRMTPYCVALGYTMQGH